MSICVLSLEEAASAQQNTGEITITLPSDVLSHSNSGTVFVLNKTDLVRDPAQASESDIRDGLRRALSQAVWNNNGQTPHAWTLSLRTGEGTREFLDELAIVLKERVA